MSISIEEYYDYILEKKEVPSDKKILYEILHDFTDRRGLRHGWEQIDPEIKQEILDKWHGIIKNHMKEE